MSALLANGTLSSAAIEIAADYADLYGERASFAIGVAITIVAVLGSADTLAVYEGAQTILTNGHLA